MPESNGAQRELEDWMLSGYRHVIETGKWDGGWLVEATGASSDDIVKARRLLVDLQLIEPSPDSESGWRAVSPQTAIAKLVMPLENEARRQAAYAESLRDRLQRLLPIHEANYAFSQSHAVEVVPDTVALDALVDEEMARSTTEIIVMRRRADRSTAGHRRYSDARRRGVQVRTLFQHSTRDDLPTGEFVEAFSDAGAQFRTVDELPAELLIFDRSACVLVADVPCGEDSRPTVEDADVAAILRHPLVVSSQIDMFENAWARGSAFSATEPQPSWIDSELRRSIFRLLAAGVKDEAVARRLGISVRSCRRYVADVMNELGATSRFQAGVEVQRRGLL